MHFNLSTVLLQFDFLKAALIGEGAYCRAALILNLVSMTRRLLDGFTYLRPRSLEEIQ